MDRPGPSPDHPDESPVTRPNDVFDPTASGFDEQCRRDVQVILDAETDETRAEAEAWFELNDNSDWTA